jgi:RHS repeat-associated protein
VTAFGYAGEYTDGTGLIYLRARYYDPGTAQFLSVDPLIDLTQDAYGYASGNPLQLVDPLGLWGWTVWEWSADELDTASTILGGVALALAVTGVGGPVAAVVGGLATAASVGAAAKHANDGDLGAAAISAVGAVPGLGSLGAKLTSAGARAAAGAATATTRMGSFGPGRAARGVEWVFDRVGDFSWALSAPTDAISSLRCAA